MFLCLSLMLRLTLNGDGFRRRHGRNKNQAVNRGAVRADGYPGLNDSRTIKARESTYGWKCHSCHLSASARAENPLGRGHPSYLYPYVA